MVLRRRRCISMPNVRRRHPLRHSANSLASRHRNVSLHTSSCKASQPPAWFTKKPRTPSQAKATSRPSLPIVPEIGSDDPFLEENDEQLFCRVPVFDAFADELCTVDMVVDDDQEALRDLNLNELLSGCEAADVESLIEADWATGSDDGIELIDGKKVREEGDKDHEVGGVIGCAHSQLEWEIDWTMENSRMVEMKREDVVKMNEKKRKRKRMMLRLNYESVIAAWASRGSPWTHGIRTQDFNLDETFMGA